MRENVLLVFSGLFGAVIGSFLNVCIFRLPRNCMSLVKPRSRCPRCLALIRWFDNIPLVSWVALGGRCRSCGQAISPRYLAVEALTAALFVAVASPQIWGAGPAGDRMLLFAVQAWFVSCLIVCTFIDLDFRILPDEITVSGVVIGLAASAIFPVIQPGAANVIREPWLSAAAGSALGAVLGGGASWLVGRRRRASGREAGFLGSARLVALAGAILGLGLSARFPLFEPARRILISEPWLASLSGSVLGALLGGGVIWAVGELGSYVFRKEAMGFGDVKFMAMVGAVLGPKGVMLTFVLACLFGSLFGVGKFIAVRRMGHVPFGPFLSAGAVFMLLGSGWVDRGVRAYLELFRPPIH